MDSELIGIFLDEAEDNLHLWEKSLLELQSEKQAQSIETISRVAHNLKGSSRTLGMEKFGSFLHSFEDFLGAWNSGQVEQEQAEAVLFKVHNTLDSWVHNLRQNYEYVPDLSIVLDEMKQLILESDEIDESQDLPPRIGELLIESGVATQEQIDDAVKLQQSKIGEIICEQNNIDEDIINAQLEKQKQLSGGKIDETLRISRSKLDSVLRLIGELSIHHTVLQHGRKNENLNTNQVENAIDHGSKIVNELQSEVLSLRMQPVQGLFQRLKRTGLDVARTLKKPIQIDVTGSEVELDKSVLEKVSEPLIHIIRNAVDHGIEDVESRKSRGKPEAGSIHLTAIQDAGGVVIRVEDDGAGIDTEKIFQKAVKREIVPSNAKLTYQQKLDLLFHPGLSTASQVSEISGRGVGMDVVKRVVNDLNGTVTIETEKEKSSCVTIRLPTSLNILEALIVSIQKQQYAIPVSDLEEVLDMERISSTTGTATTGVFELRGNIIPIRDLKKALPIKTSLASGTESASEQDRYILVAHTRKSSFGFSVGQVLGRQQVVVRTLSGTLSELKGVSGATILGNGEPGLILNLPQLAEQYEQA